MYMNDTAKLIRLKCNVNRNGIHLPSISIFTNGIPPKITFPQPCRFL